MNYILTDARIYTLKPGSDGFDRADSMLVEEGKISAIGSLRECRLAAKKHTELISLKGKVLLPAFCDTHTHFVELAKGRFQLKLQGIDTIDGIRDAASRYKQSRKQMPDWVLGDGWDINRIDDPQSIRRELLDELFPDHPVALFSKDYHAKWCNTKALEICGLLRPGNKGFGPELVKRDVEGFATGLIYESATEYLDRYVIPPSEIDLQEAIREELESSYRLGLGGFHSMEGEASAMALKRAQESGAMFRYVWHFPLDDLDRMIERGTRSYIEQGSFIIGGVKIFGDGSLGSRTAAMIAPYYDDATNRGVLRYSADELDAAINKAGTAGIACTIHAIGDLTSQVVINSFNKNRLTYLDNKLLHRVEHLQCVSTDDLITLKASGAYCALQPVHLANDIPMIESAWKGIEDRAYRLKDIVELDIPHGFGSDAPIETIDPFKGIYSAIARKPMIDPSLASWHPEQRINVHQALKAYTYGAAMGSGSQSWRGSLAVGMAADIIAVEDWSGKPDEFWLEQRCRMNMVNGHINYIDI